MFLFIDIWAITKYVRDLTGLYRVRRSCSQGLKRLSIDNFFLLVHIIYSSFTCPDKLLGYLPVSPSSHLIFGIFGHVILILVGFLFVWQATFHNSGRESFSQKGSCVVFRLIQIITKSRVKCVTNRSSFCVLLPLFIRWNEGKQLQNTKEYFSPIFIFLFLFSRQ